MQLNLNVKYNELWYSELLDYRVRLTLQPEVFNDAIRIFEEGRKNKLLQGRSNKILVLVSVYCALKVHAIQIDLEELITKRQVPGIKVRRLNRIIEIQILPRLNLHPHRFSIIDYIKKFADKLKLISDCKMKAIELINSLTSKGIYFLGKDPNAIAGAAIYISSKMLNIRLTQEEINGVIKTAMVTLRRRIKDIQQII